MSVEKQSKGIKGGARPGAGRKKGAPNKRTAEVQKAVEESGLTPLDFMLSIMRKADIPKDASVGQQIALYTLRFEAAKAAAPYVHPKLSSVEMTGKGGGPVDMNWNINFVSPNDGR